METETVRVHRVKRLPIATWGPWQVGPLPDRSTWDEIDIKWALIADEPMDSAGNAPSPGDQLIGRLEWQHQDRVVLTIDGDPRFSGNGLQWTVNLSVLSGDGSPAEGKGDTVVEAIENFLKDAAVE